MRGGSDQLDVPEDLSQEPGFDQQGVDNLQIILQEVVERWGELLPVDTTRLKKRWQDYIPWLVDILSDLEAYHQEVCTVQC